MRRIYFLYPRVGVQKWSRQKLGEKSTHTLVIYYQSIKYNKRIHA